MTDYESDDQDVTTEGNDGTTLLNTYLDFNYETFDYSGKRTHDMDCDFDPETNSSYHAKRM